MAGRGAYWLHQARKLGTGVVKGGVMLYFLFKCETSTQYPGPWILYPGFMLSDPGSRILDRGSRILGPQFWIRDSRPMILNPGSRSLIGEPTSRILDHESRNEDPVLRIPDAGSQIWGPGGSIQDRGSSIHAPGSRIPVSGSWAPVFTLKLTSEVQIQRFPLFTYPIFPTSAGGAEPNINIAPAVNQVVMWQVTYAWCNCSLF